MKVTNMPKTIACNVLFQGIGNIKLNLIGDSFDEILVKLHVEELNDRYVDGFTEAGQAFRVYRSGISGIGEVQTAAQKAGLIVPGGRA